MIDLALIQHCISTAFPNSEIARTEILSGGLINTNIKIEFRTHQPPVVLRFYREGEPIVFRTQRDGLTGTVGDPDGNGQRFARQELVLDRANFNRDLGAETQGGQTQQGHSESEDSHGYIG